MTKLIAVGVLLLALAGGGVAWYLRRKNQAAKLIRAQNPDATPEQVEVLASRAMDEYLAGVRQHLSGASRVQFDRLVEQVKDLAKKAQAKAEAAVSAVIPAKAEDEAAKA